MKLNPNKLHTTREVRLYKRATEIMKRADSFAEGTKALDQTSSDFNSTPDHVLLDGVRVSAPRSNYGSVTLKRAEFMSRGSVSQFEGNTYDTEVKRHETKDKIHYVHKETRYEKADTTKISLDKATGLIQMRDYAFGFIPVKTSV